MADDAATSEGRRFADAFAAEAGAAMLSDADVDAILGMAADAARASERLAAPLVSWLAGRSGLSLDDARAIVARLAG